MPDSGIRIEGALMVQWCMFSDAMVRDFWQLSLRFWVVHYVENSAYKTAALDAQGPANGLCLGTVAKDLNRHLQVCSC